MSIRCLDMRTRPLQHSPWLVLEENQKSFSLWEWGSHFGGFTRQVYWGPLAHRIWALPASGCFVSPFPIPIPDPSTITLYSSFTECFSLLLTDYLEYLQKYYFLCLWFIHAPPYLVNPSLVTQLEPHSILWVHPGLLSQLGTLLHIPYLSELLVLGSHHTAFSLCVYLSPLLDSTCSEIWDCFFNLFCY